MYAGTAMTTGVDEGFPSLKDTFAEKRRALCSLPDPQ